MKIGDGTIAKQQPDGPELVASMERAVVRAAGIIEWSEMCFCPSPPVAKLAEFIITDYVLVGVLTERTTNFAVSIAVMDVSKVCIIVIPLVGIAGHTKCLEVAQFIPAAFIARNDVIDM